MPEQLRRLKLRDFYGFVFLSPFCLPDHCIRSDLASAVANASMGIV
jgi:hypothetical protein